MPGRMEENPTNATILLIFTNTERLMCTHWQVCTSIALGWLNAWLQRWCVTWGKRNKAVTSVLPLTAKLQMVRWHLWLRLLGLVEQTNAGVQEENGNMPTYRQTPLSRRKCLATTMPDLKCLIATDEHFEADRPAVKALVLENRILLLYYAVGLGPKKCHSHQNLVWTIL